jgi:transposase
MYIRRTTIKSRKDGKQYFAYRFVESTRIGKKVRQNTVFNIGANFSLPRDQWPILCSRIKDIISGQKNLLKVSGKIEQLAQDYAARIIHSKADIIKKRKANFHEVDINSLEAQRPRSISCEHVALETLRFLGLDKKFKGLKLTGPQIAAAIGTIIGRMCHPGSELSTHNWLQNKTGLGELIDYDFNKTSLYRMYQVSDMLLKHKKPLEDFLFTKEQSLFEFGETITLYDLTNTYFEGSGLHNELAAYGHSKEKRTDCPLVTLGLVLDGSGFPRRSEIFKGNVNEASTMAGMIQGLQDNTLSEKPTIVMDAGIATQDNIEWLKTSLYPYIVVSRKGYRQFDEEQSHVVKKDDNCIVKAQKVIDPDSGETLLYCHSTRREKKEQAINNRINERFLEAMNKLEQGLHKKRCVKKYDKVLERIGRIKQRFSKAAKQYKIKVQKNKKTGNAVKITWNHKSDLKTKEGLPGVYCLRTNYTTLTESELWHTYTMLTDLESVFRSLKSELGLRPVYHQTTDHVSGHLFITVLAYHLVHTIRYQLKQSGIDISWDNLRQRLTGQNRNTISMQCKNGNVIHVRKSTRPEPEQQKIYRVLGVDMHPGKIIKKILKNEQK